MVGLPRATAETALHKDQYQAGMEGSENGDSGVLSHGEKQALWRQNWV